MEHLNNSSTSSSTMTTTTTSVLTPNNTPASSTVLELNRQAAVVAPAITTTAAATAKPPAAVPVLEHRSLVPEKWGDQVRAIGIAEYKEAALSLAQAFASDDLARYLVDAEGGGDGGDDTLKWRLHVDIMNYIVAAHCYSGVVTTIGADYDGVALWLPPGQTMDDWWTTLRSGMWRLYWQLSPEGRRRYYGELLPLLHDTKRDVMGDRDDDCYYLVYLGTKPSGRGRGYAAKLIEDMAVKADAENRAMYLESSSLKNNAYYAKFGFEVKKDIYMGMDESWSPDDDSTPPPPVRMSIMVREPHPQRQQQQQQQQHPHFTAAAAPTPLSSPSTSAPNNNKQQQLKSGIMAAAAASGHHHHHHMNKQIVCGGGLAQRVQ